MKSLLAQASAFAASNHIQLRIATVPFFPPDFYRQQGAAWSDSIRDYNFLAPERALKEWASSQKIPLLPLGERMQNSKLTTEQIRALYLSKGSGHFSEAGHTFAAESMQSAFFAERP